jgi:beta-glucosidase
VCEDSAQPLAHPRVAAGATLAQVSGHICPIAVRSEIGPAVSAGSELESAENGNSWTPSRHDSCAPGEGEWGFKGWVTSDYGAVHATSDLLAGTDQEFLTFFMQDDNLLPLVDPASAQYDPRYAAAARESSARILYQYERFGLLDNGHIPARHRSRVPQHGDVDTTDNTVTVDKQAGIDTALDLAEKAQVLLKNEAALPLTTKQSVAVMGQSATLLPAAAGGERSTGFGDQVTITPHKAMTKVAGTNVTSVPGVDVLGDAIPAYALTQDAAGTTPGLVRTQTLPSGAVSSSFDTVLGGNQTNLVKGATYSWTGYVNVPAQDTYRLLIQRPVGVDTGNRAKFNDGIRTEPFTTTAVFPGYPSVPPVTTTTLSIDGVARTMADPDSKVLANAYPSYSTDPAITTKAANGQYLGYANTATSAELTPGRHQVTVTYAPRENLRSRRRSGWPGRPRKPRWSRLRRPRQSMTCPSSSPTTTV